MMTPQIVPKHLDLKKDERLVVEWSDGRACVYTISYLRSMCPCAQCRIVREGEQKKKSPLTILPGNYSGALSATSAELVGNYALKLAFSDNHDTGIYSFEYLRQIAPQ